jgi:hypothetical protein
MIIRNSRNNSEVKGREFSENLCTWIVYFFSSRIYLLRFAYIEVKMFAPHRENTCRYNTAFRKFFTFRIWFVFLFLCLVNTRKWSTGGKICNYSFSANFCFRVFFLRWKIFEKNTHEFAQILLFTHKISLGFVIKITLLPPLSPSQYKM